MAQDPRIIDRIHHEYSAYADLWRRQLASLEGGAAYREATFPDPHYGLVNNLVRHKREYPIPHRPTQPVLEYPQPQPNQAGGPEDDFELRRLRTPPPQLMEQAIARHVGTIYSEEIKRAGPAPYEAWAGDVDGKGTTLDDWMRESVAPVFFALGQVDILVDRPTAPAGSPIESLADVRRLRLDRARAAIVLPTNLLWWRLAEDGAEGHYEEALVREFFDDDEGRQAVRYWHWTRDGVTLYDCDGEEVDSRAHGYGRVPILRAFVRRRLTALNVGRSPYEAVLDLEREYYNVDSEQVLSNAMQSHPTLQGPPDAFTGDGEVMVGAGWTLKKQISGQNGTSIDWSYVDPPKGAFEALQTSKADLRDRIDALTCQSKPAGSAAGGGSGGATVSQSGISKALDQDTGNRLLCSLARSLAKLEAAIGELALAVLGDRSGNPVRVEYPQGFNLFTADDLAAQGSQLQLFAEQAGALPEVEAAWLKQWTRKALPGRDDDVYRLFDSEIDSFIGTRSADYQARRESGAVGPDPGAPQPLGD